MRKKVFFALLLFSAMGFVAGIVFALVQPQSVDSLRTRITDNNEIVSPFLDGDVELPLEKYTISNLQNYPFVHSEIVLDKVIEKFPEFTAYQFSYVSMGKRMTGQINVPSSTEIPESKVLQLASDDKVIVMLRGFVPREQYETGTGTRNAAAVYAKSGYVTIAPDFFGYGESDQEPEDSWEARFVKPINVIELLKSVEVAGTDQIALWGHSNGGQIALSVLEITGKSIPTTLWAPVTAPFPYSVLFFGDELPDEGKEQRAWLAIFERDYDAHDFSVSQHLSKLRGPLVFHHGTVDEAALFSWTLEFVDKIEAENLRRADLVKDASASANTPPKLLEEIEYDFYRYPGANHNLQPGWNTVVQRDLVFFNQEL